MFFGKSISGSIFDRTFERKHANHKEFIEGGQRPVTAAPLFWVLAVWDLVGMTGWVYVRTVCRCNR